MPKIKYLSVCSGMEAATVAWHHMGWTPVGFSEIEPFPSQILKHHYPTIPNYGDLTKFKEWPIQRGAIDLLVGGTPCQAFSVAGLRKGLDDPRGNLALTFLALADHLRPKYILWENVPGVLSSSGGRDFGSFLGALVELGYGFAYRVLDAQFVGGSRAVPQRRRRVFVVACLGDWRASAEVLSLSEGVSGYLKTGNKKRKGTTSDAGASVETGSKGVAFRKSKRACSTTDNETWVQADSSNTLNNFDLGDTRTTHAVVNPIAIQETIIGRSENSGPQGSGVTENGSMYTLTKTDIHGVLYENHPNDSRVTGPHDVAPTVVSRFGTGGGNVPFVNQEPITFQPGNLRRDAGADPSTQATTTLKATPGDQMPHIATSMAVRRLTPVECERLQGFPDNYSQIPWKGKPASECPDGPRYKACGNSMAVPVMRFIGERIQKQIDGTLPK